MAHTLNIPGYAFVGNPVVFRDDHSGLGQIPYTVKVGGVIRYTGLYTPPCAVDVAEIIASFVDPLPDAGTRPYNESGWIVRVEDPSDVDRRVAKVEYYGGKTLGPFIALQGGVSTQNFRYLLDSNTEIFTRKLLNPHANFLLSTRTQTWQLRMRETELYPLCFIVDGQMKLEVKPKSTGYALSANLADGIFALDIESVRRKIWEKYRYIASVFEISVDGEFACRIEITEALPCPERHLVKFRNSFGAFEVVDFSGTATASSSSAMDEDDGDEFDTRTRRYRKRSGMSDRTTSITIGSGPKRPDELTWIGDMLMSSEVYLKTEGGWTRATATAEKTDRACRQIQPESITVKFEYADTDSNSTPEIGDKTEFERPRIFSDEHDETFN